MRKKDFFDFFRKIELYNRYEMFRATPAIEIKKWVMMNILRELEEKEKKIKNKGRIKTVLIKIKEVLLFAEDKALSFIPGEKVRKIVRNILNVLISLIGVALFALTVF